MSAEPALPVQVLGLSPDSPFVTSSRLDSLSLAEKEALLPSLEQRCAEKAAAYSRRCQSVLSRRSYPDLERGAAQRQEIAEKEARVAEARARELREDADRLAKTWASMVALEEGQARLGRSKREEEIAVLSRGYREALGRKEEERRALRAEQQRERQEAREMMARGAEAARRGREQKVLAGAEAKRACLESAQRRREQRAAEKSDEIDPFESSYRALDRSTVGLVGSQRGVSCAASCGAGSGSGEASQASHAGQANQTSQTGQAASAPASSSAVKDPDGPLHISALSGARGAHEVPGLSAASPGRAVSSTALSRSQRVRVGNYAGPEDDTPALQRKEAQRQAFLQEARRESLDLQARKREEAYAALQAEKAQFYKQYQAMAEAVRNRRAQRVQEQRKYHAELESAEKARKLAEDIRKVDEMIERKKREYAAQREEAKRAADARAAERARRASERAREAEERREREIARRFTAAFEQLHSM